jgi:hypothetical protein
VRDSCVFSGSPYQAAAGALACLHFFARRLEAQLAARLQAARTLPGGTGGGYGAAAMVLDAHRQASFGFLHAGVAASWSTPQGFLRVWLPHRPHEQPADSCWPSDPAAISCLHTARCRLPCRQKAVFPPTQHMRPRQAFEGFLQAMTTYRPLLLRVKAAYDPVLRDAAASTYDNVHLRGELARAPAELVRAHERVVALSPAASRSLAASEAGARLHICGAPPNSNAVLMCAVCCAQAVAVEEAHNAAEAVAAGMLRELEEKLASAEAEAEEVGSRALDTRVLQGRSCRGAGAEGPGLCVACAESCVEAAGGLLSCIPRPPIPPNPCAAPRPSARRVTLKTSCRGSSAALPLRGARWSS